MSQYPGGCGRFYHYTQDKDLIMSPTVMIFPRQPPPNPIVKLTNTYKIQSTILPSTSQP